MQENTIQRASVVKRAWCRPSCSHGRGSAAFAQPGIALQYLHLKTDPDYSRVGRCLAAQTGAANLQGIPRQTTLVGVGMPFDSQSVRLGLSFCIITSSSHVISFGCAQRPKSSSAEGFCCLVMHVLCLSGRSARSVCGRVMREILAEAPAAYADSETTNRPIRANA